MLAEIERGRREATLNLFSNVTKEGMGVGVWHPLPPHTHTHFEKSVVIVGFLTEFLPYLRNLIKMVLSSEILDDYAQIRHKFVGIFISSVGLSFRRNIRV